MRQINDEGLALIKQYEGFSPVVYICPAGYPTIGYGHLVRQNERGRWDNGICEQQAEKLLREDVAIAERAVLRLIHVPLTDNQFSALVSFTFNLGSGALQRSTLRRVINRENHDAVPDQLMRWVWAGGRKMRGLIRRRRAEAALYMA